MTLLSAQTQNASTESKQPLKHAHAHNDYEHSRPLLDALDRGFTSIEADIYLVDGELLVAHYQKDVKRDRTLEKLYLQPLYERFKKNRIGIYPSGEAITLLVDIKNQGAATYRVLEKQLAKYADMLSVTRSGRHIVGAVTIIISGDRPVEAVKASNPCYVGIDGRLSDLQSDEPSWLIPLISDNWLLNFRYRGNDAMPEEERARLASIVKQAHDKNRRVRFWATTESEQLWRELQTAGVDLIGTDNLDRLEMFFRQPQ